MKIVGNRRRSERAADRERGEMTRPRRRALPARGIGGGNVLALDLGIDAAHHALGHRMRGCQHGEVDLQHGAEGVVMAVQRRQQLGRRLRQDFLRGLEMLDRDHVAARHFRLLLFQPHRLRDLAGANQFGLALDQAEQRTHHVDQLFGELADLGRGRRHGLCSGYGRCSLRRTLVHLALPSCRSGGTVDLVGLLHDQRAEHVPGNSDAAGLGEGFRILLCQHRAPYAGAGGVAERAFALDAAGHLREHRIEEHRLEIGRGRLGFRLRLRRHFGQRFRQRGVGTAVEHRQHGFVRHAAGGADQAGGGAGLHHITSMSAWIAPAALIACRMPIRSRGPMPSPLRPSTSCCSETPSLTSASFLPSSVTWTLLRGVTTVRPRDSGLGWLTCGLSEIVTVRLPCATATVATRTSRPITMMPERSSITILAARSGSTCNCSISVRKATTLPLNSAGIESCTVEGSIGSAVWTPRKSLTAAAMRLAVVKSALRSANRTLGSRLSANSISRSMMAPLAMRPTIGTPRVILAASPSAWKPPTATEPCATA